MKERVVVAMSGGVDSSVAACLLRDKGYEVIGITMCFNLADSLGKRPGCCGIQGIEDARRVAQRIGIRHYVLNMQKVLNEYVIRDFREEYIRGRTPNPCVRCNQYIKFDVLLKKAISLDAKFLATGHYASIFKTHNAQRKTQNYFLKKAKDLKKDQTYFLYRLTQYQLKHILFPLSNLKKEEVRSLARKFKLPVADKLASQEICFLSDTDYRAFLKNEIPQDIKPGPIIDKQGNIFGLHKGIAFYTIGQRAGLGIAKGYPLYITQIDSLRNRVTVGRKEEVLKKEFLIKEQHFIFKPIKKKVALSVRIRYNHKEAKAVVIPLKNKIKVKFNKPQFAITPGQSAVFYTKDTVLGGGIIDKVLD